MKHSLTGATLLASTIISFPAAAVDITYRAAIAYQQKEVTFDQEYKLNGTSLNEAKFTASLPIISTSFTVAFDRYFAVLKYEQATSSDSTETSETDRSEPDSISANLIGIDGSNVEVEREDISFTLGARVWKTLAVFGGYLDGETTLRPQPFCSTPATDPNCIKLNRAFQHFIAGSFTPGLNQGDYEQTYSETGWFAGVSYSWNIMEIGSLSLNGAWASMDGKYEDNANDPAEVWEGILQKFRYEGDSDGISVGLTWTAPISDNTEYFLDVRVQQYSMTANDTTGQAAQEDITLKTDETMNGLTAGIQVYF